MALNDYSPIPLPDTPLPTTGAFTITVNEGERQVLVMALGELLNSTRRGEHLDPTIQALLDRLQRIATTTEPA